MTKQEFLHGVKNILTNTLEEIESFKNFFDQERIIRERALIAKHDPHLAHLMRERENSINLHNTRIAAYLSTRLKQ